MPRFRQLDILFVLAVATSAVVGCSSNPGGTVDGQTAAGETVASNPSASTARCVDAEGPNSSPQQIAVAWSEQPMVDADTNGLTTMGDYVRRSMQNGTYLGDPATAFVDASEVFVDVPEGGDAEFARTVCDSYTVAVGLRGYGLEDRLRATPHALRYAGRDICGSIADYPGSLVTRGSEYLDDKYGYILDDPASYIQGMYESAKMSRDSVAQRQEVAGPSPDETVKAWEEALADPQSFVDETQRQRQFDVAALTHQCPQFGPAE